MYEFVGPKPKDLNVLKLPTFIKYIQAMNPLYFDGGVSVQSNMKIFLDIPCIELKSGCLIQHSSIGRAGSQCKPITLLFYQQSPRQPVKTENNTIAKMFEK